MSISSTDNLKFPTAEYHKIDTKMQNKIAYMWSYCQIECNTPSLQAHEKNFAVWIFSESPNGSIPSSQWHASIQLNTRYSRLQQTHNITIRMHFRRINQTEADN